VYKHLHFLVIGLSLLSLPVLAQQANFSTLTLEKGFDSSKAFVMGYTGGTFSLANIAKVDSQNRPCIGYGAAANPDHLVVLKSDFPKLKLLVESDEHGTTLLIKDNKTKTISCVFGKAAQIQAENWASGEYEVWVGSIEPGKRIAYRLKAESVY